MEQGENEAASHFFQVRLSEFDGPIDLLLHLVKQNELPITKISLAQLAEQYSACLADAVDFDLEVAGEYLVIAATLLSIKAAFVLNKPVELMPDEDGNLVDPHEELLRRLREAEVYREGASKLGGMDLLGISVFAPPPSLRQVKDTNFTFADHDAMLLGRAFTKALKRLNLDSREYQITLEAVSVVEQMAAVLDVLRSRGTGLRFEDLIPATVNRGLIVGIFIALLELCKRQVIKVSQEENFGEILISLAEYAGEATSGPLSLESEFDNAKSANE